MFKYNVFSVRYVNNNFRFTLTLILLCVLIVNCNTRKNNSSVELKVNREIESEEFQIMLWQGGGFTGLKTGFTLSSIGEVTHWQQHPGQADSVFWIAKGYVSEIKKLRNQLDESGALDKQYSEFGNMTFGIDYKTNGKNYTWTWSQLESEDNNLGKLRDWYQNARKFCQSLDGNQ